MFMSGEQLIIRINANLVWHIGPDPDNGTWVGVCRELNLNAVGDTFKEVQIAAGEAVGLLLEDLFEEGDLDTFLRAQGWQAAINMPPRSSGQKVHFDVPFNVETQRSARDLVPA